MCGGGGGEGRGGVEGVPYFCHDCIKIFSHVSCSLKSHLVLYFCVHYSISVAEKPTELFHNMWIKEAIPQEFKDVTIIHLFKRKGNPQVCDNHRGISLLSIAGKILAGVLLNRLNEHLERSGLLPESQC